MIKAIASVALFVLVGETIRAQDYVVVTCGGQDDFHKAAQVLAEHHGAKVIAYDAKRLKELADQLRKIKPRFVAYVLRPEQIDFNVTRRLLQMASEIDADPFVDFEYGFFTGATGGETLRFVRRSIAFKARQKRIEYGVVSGGLPFSKVVDGGHALRKSSIDKSTIYVAGKKVFPDEGRDREFMRAKLPALAKCNLVKFAGHGIPREIVGGPDWRDLKDLSLPGAVVLNVGCYTAVTSRYFKTNYREKTNDAHTVPLAESFALCVLRSGVVGYTAYTCPRPSGPELDTDIDCLIAQGLSLGAARRRDYDKTVLGFMGFGDKRMELKDLVDGGAARPMRDAVRDIMMECATGGILFGDPSLKPFAVRPGDELVRTRVAKLGSNLRVRIDCPTGSTNLVCNDPTARIGKYMALKAYARVPLGKRFIREVIVDEVMTGDDEAESHRLVWAFEEDQGEHFAQIKVIVQREMRSVDLRVDLRILTCATRDEAKLAGGSPPTKIKPRPVPRPRGAKARSIRPAAARVDLSSTEITKAMRRISGKWKVKDEVLAVALKASKLALTRREKATVAELKGFGSEGFRALCLLLEIGHHHYRTADLLERTYTDDDGKHLMTLVRMSPLPRYADWTVLDALGLDASANTKAYLLKRMKAAGGGMGAGVFAACALGLGRMHAEEAVALIGDRLMKMTPTDRGVHPMMIRALGRMGSAEAVRYLERYAAKEGAFQSRLARTTAGKSRAK